MIKTARFLTSNQDAKKCPPPNKPEYAFIGRSNVGKSSLINMLCQSKKLAKISSTPGKTQLINHFIINDSWYIVDLPGYGYAKVAKTKRAAFSKMTLEYLNTRENLICLFVLIDVRIEPQALDLEFLNTLGDEGVPFVMVFTKADKLTPTVLEKNITHYKAVMQQEWDELPQMIVTSAEKGTGRDEVLSFIENINKEWSP
jgi:GTP-binding protein